MKREFVIRGADEEVKRVEVFLEQAGKDIDLRASVDGVYQTILTIKSNGMFKRRALAPSAAKDMGIEINVDNEICERGE